MIYIKELTIDGYISIVDQTTQYINKQIVSEEYIDQVCSTEEYVMQEIEVEDSI